MTCATCGGALPDGRRRWCNDDCKGQFTRTLAKACEWCGGTFTAADRKLTGVRFERLRFCGNRCAMLSKRNSGIVSTTRHGMSRTPLYRIWAGMIGRCHNPNAKHFDFYGGRGIAVCSEWRGPDGFARFAACIGPRPSPKHTVDRIDNSKGYEPGNVRWATKKEQQRNMRSNRWVTLGNSTRTVAEWIELFPLDSDLVWSRLKTGWEPVLAFFTPRIARSDRGRGRPAGMAQLPFPGMEAA